MKKLICFLILSLALSALCIQEKESIAWKIFTNECGKKKEALTTWNLLEEFPSFGLGHFIWLPEGVNVPFEEKFPKFIEFLKTKDVKIDLELLKSAKAPWKSRDAFLKEMHLKNMNDLRDFLASTFTYQMDFILEEFEVEIIKMKQQKDTHFLKKLDLLKSEKNGYYALIDYCNFKGSGLNVAERYNTQGWGLLQVIEAMPYPTQNPLQDFVKSADLLLQKRVENSPKNRDEQRYLKGWQSRLKTYLN